MKTKRYGSCLLLAIIFGLIFIIGSGYFLFNGTKRPVETEAPVTPHLHPGTATMPVSMTQSGPPTITEKLAMIDEALKQTLPASIAYNAPLSMHLNETVTLELLLNPSVEPADLERQVVEPGEVVTASVQVTPKMKAELLAQNEAAFDIHPLHDSPEQFISGTETTYWTWDVTARQGGTQRLTLIIYRLIAIDGEEEWRKIETYRSNVEVEISFIQRLVMFDWQWILGILITALLIPAFWRWYEKRKKQDKPVDVKKD